MTWDFFQRYDDSWIWRCIDRHDITESSRNFAAFDECVEDAARHGYVPQRGRTNASPNAQTGRTRTSSRRRNVTES